MAADSSLLPSLVEEYVSGLQDSKSLHTVNVNFPLLLCSSLSLTSSQPHTRARGVQLLSEVLQECYGVFTVAEVEVLISFYENRLKDHHVVIPPVLQGLRALVRDPRNLLLAFQVAKNIIHRGYELGSFTEEMFEVTSCYFPIDFAPPPNDPHGITREELVVTLRDVLVGTPKFAEFLLPLIIEKLDSDVQSAKLDSLQTLTACVTGYEHKDLAEFLGGLWASLRREVFQTASEKIESASLAAVTALTSCLSRSVLKSDSEDSLHSFLELVLKGCKHHLCEPDLKLVWPSAKLLQAACSASNRAGHIITSAVMPLLTEQYHSRTECSHRRTLLEVVQKFMQAVKPRQSSDLFLAFRPSLCSMVFSALVETNASLQITAASVLTLLAQQTGLLLDSDIELAVDHLTRLLLTEDDDRVSLAVVECVGALADVYVRISMFCLNLINVLIMTEVMDQDNNTVASEQSSHHALRQRCMAALAMASTQPSVVLESTPVLLEVLSSAHTGNVSGERGSTGQTASRAVSLFLDGDVSFLPDNSFPSHLQLLKVGILQSQLVCLLMACVCTLPRSVEVPQIDRLLSQLEEMSCTCSHQLSYSSAAKCFAGLVNKRPQGDSLDRLIQGTMARVCSELDSTSSPLRSQAFTLMIWVAKALLLRYHPLITTLTDKLFSLLTDDHLGLLAADGFSLLMTDSVDILNRSCHADVRIMYRQRFFSENSPKLVQGFNAARQGKKKPNYLKALSNIVEKLPKQVQVTELPALLSLLLEALSCPDQGVQLSTLSCLQPVLVDPPPALIQQLEALFSRLLALTSSPSMVSFTSFAVYKYVLPFRARVLRALARPLDDRKRLVRQEAVQARAEWFLLGSPGGR
uniref:MMS19 nucleotide excision repair protein n=1 Tax=Takifugu rubripes TaxID=31033 RepID=A0A674NVD6_TAKRU